MKEYTSENPVFSKSIRVTETTDPAHADNINAAPEQLLQNTLVLNEQVKNISNIAQYNTFAEIPVPDEEHDFTCTVVYNGKDDSAPDASDNDWWWNVHQFGKADECTRLAWATVRAQTTIYIQQKHGSDWCEWGAISPMPDILPIEKGGTGNSEGKVASATKATQDESGNNIVTTYATKKVATSSSDGLMSASDKASLELLLSGKGSVNIRAYRIGGLADTEYWEFFSMTDGQKIDAEVPFRRYNVYFFNSVHKKYVMLGDYRLYREDGSDDLRELIKENQTYEVMFTGTAYKINI